MKASVVIVITLFIRVNIYRGRGYNFREGRVSMLWHPDLNILSMVMIYSP
jgi:hypothetical protein